MRTTRVGRRFLTAAGIVFAAVASHAGTSAIAYAEEIAWRQLTEQTAGLGGGMFTREGKATFKGGETATVATTSKMGPSSADASFPFEGQAVFTFVDGSTFTARFGGTDKFDYTQTGWGEFISGTGRFQGIAGRYTFQGKRGDTEHVGTYSLPSK
jgi:hypothetical protein